MLGRSILRSQSARSASNGALIRSTYVPDSEDWKYEDYLHTGKDFGPALEEIQRRERAGWSLWSTQEVGDDAVLLQFRYPSEWKHPDGEADPS